MKQIEAFKTLIYFLNLFSTLKSQKVSTTIVSHAIADIIDILGDSHAMRFEIIVASKNKQLEVIASKILKKTSSPVSVRYCTYDEKHHIFKGTPTIFLTDGNNIGEFHLEDFPVPHNKTGIEKRQTNSFVDTAFIIYEYGSSEIYIRNNNGIGSFYYQILFSAHDENPILANFIPLTNKSCVPSWQNISEFSTQKMSWSSKIFVRKYEKFYNCPIVIRVFEGITGGVSDTIFKSVKKKNGYRTFSGIGGEVLNVFISKYEMQVVQHNEGEVYDIATIPFNIVIGSNVHLTPPITYLYSTFLLTYGHFYDPFEKIILPFDKYIWFAVISTFCAASISIFITYRFSKNTQDYIFGIGVSYPTLGLLQIFFGLGYVHLPHRNFARILFIAFTIFCLVIRTGYQGKMFDFMIGDIRKPMPDTIEELLKSGIHIFRGANGGIDVFDM